LLLQHGRTALHHAALNGNSHVVKLLIDHGARLDARAWDGKTPFNYAAENCKAETLRYLHFRAQEARRPATSFLVHVFIFCPCLLWQCLTVPSRLQRKNMAVSSRASTVSGTPRHATPPPADSGRQTTQSPALLRHAVGSASPAASMSGASRPAAAHDAGRASGSARPLAINSYSNGPPAATRTTAAFGGAARLNSSRSGTPGIEQGQAPRLRSPRLEDEVLALGSMALDAADAHAAGGQREFAG
jgi:hypothetical protein